MKEIFVRKFRNGKWLDKSNSLLSDKAKVLSLLAVLGRYLKKGGLRKVREDLSVFGHYSSDIIHGRYKDYKASSLTLVVAAILYVISPLDILPDLLPLGFIDDVAIVTWAASKLASELDNYRKWKGTSSV